MKRFNYALVAIGIGLLTACSSLPESSKYQLVDGIYRARIFKGESRVYLLVREDSIEAFPVRRLGGELHADTSQWVTFSEMAKSNNPLASQPFTQTSFDLDVLTIPFKYRPAAADLSKQLTTNLTGALYIGYRTDWYRVSYQKTSLLLHKRLIRHYGFSFGAFGGIGSTAMNPSVTRNQLAQEYDGLVLNKGIAGIVAVNNFTFGLGLGFDHLLDQHRSIWIYQGKPWLGLTIGLNLN